MFGTSHPSHTTSWVQHKKFISLSEKIDNKVDGGEEEDNRAIEKECIDEADKDGDDREQSTNVEPRNKPIIISIARISAKSVFLDVVFFFKSLISISFLLFLQKTF